MLITKVTFECKKINPFLAIDIRIDGQKIELGLFDDLERKELAQNLRDALDEIEPVNPDTGEKAEDL